MILTGSSARKLRRRKGINLLPGRVVSLRLDPLSMKEAPTTNLESLLYYGSLPAIRLLTNDSDKEEDLESYVETYLEEEVRSEALVRNLGTFARFLELAGVESGNVVSFRNIGKDIGVSHTTIASYYEILEDCLILERIDPIIRSKTRKKLTKSPKYLFFDMGVRRICAGEGTPMNNALLGSYFEQFVGLELIRLARLCPTSTKIRFWRDPDGPEVDWILERKGTYLPIEVKFTSKPRASMCKHVLAFIDEYSQAKEGVVVCQTPRSYQLHKKVRAISWQDLPSLF